MPAWVIAAFMVVSALMGHWMGAAGQYQETAKVQQAFDAYRVAAAEASTRAVAAAQAETTALQENKDEAIRQAEQRYAALLAANRALHTDVARLRSDLDRVPARLASASHAAVAEYAAAATDVFDQCVERYSTVAAQADGHGHDVRTLIEAWPRNQDAGNTNRQLRGDSSASAR